MEQFKARTAREAVYLPPRSIWHVTLPLPADREVALIGDVHGCIAELRTLLDQLPATAQPILLGDLINKGPDSIACLRLAMCAQDNSIVLIGWVGAWTGGGYRPRDIS
jgi:hypothetical protein